MSNTPGFTLPPLRVPGCQLWLKSDGLPPSGKVDVWYDSSGNGNNAGAL
jgi:hypothetical protein